MSNMQNFTYHCHSNFSDGSNSVEEMVLKAKEIGFSHIGLTDHLIVHKNIKQSLSYPNIKNRDICHMFNDSFSEILEKYKKHCDNIRKISYKENMKIFIGFEVDFFTYNGWLEELKDFLLNLDYDYLINGNHMFFDESGENLIDLYDLKKFYNEDYQKYRLFLSNHFKTMKKAAECGLFKFIAHIDYAKKLGEDICGSKMYWCEKIELLDSLQKTGVGTELSTKGLIKVNDFYPSSEILDEISKRNISVVISDDAHNVEELGRYFNLAEDTLQRYNIKNRINMFK